MNDESLFMARVASATEDIIEFEDHEPVAVADVSQGQVQIEFNRPKAADSDDTPDFEDETDEEGAE